MILYNVTVGVDKEVESEWIVWMKQNHIPEILKTGLFIDYKFYRVLSHQGENTASYCIQYFLRDIQKFNTYLEHHAPALVEQHKKKFDNRHVVFRTLLEEV